MEQWGEGEKRKKKKKKKGGVSCCERRIRRRRAHAGWRHGHAEWRHAVHDRPLHFAHTQRRKRATKHAQRTA